VRGIVPTAALVAAALAAGAGPAGARSFEVETTAKPYAPKLAGERVLWTQYPGRGRVELWSATAGGGAQLARRFTPAAGGFRGELATSSRRTLFSTYHYQGEGSPVRAEWLLGVPGGKLTAFDTCPDQRATMRSTDVWEDAYVYRRCDAGRGHVEVRDLSGESPPRSVGLDGYAARIAGRFVAWLEPGGYYNYFCCSPQPDVVVYDRVADAEVYRLPGSGLPGLVRGLDVQEDGKAAISYVVRRRNDIAGEALAWASPEEPHLHPVPVPNHHLNDPRIGNDLIAFQRGGNTFFDWVEHADVGIVDLNGDIRRVARRTDGWMLTESFDFDGERVAWRERGCERYRVVVRETSVEGVAPGTPAECPLRLLRPPKVGDGIVMLHLGCGPLDASCHWRVSLRTAGPRRMRIGRGRSEGRQPVLVLLSRAGERLLERKGSLRVTVRAEIPWRWKPEVRRATIRLRAGG
jgi:hypothetical protein